MKIFFTLLLIILCSTTNAQRRFIVICMETRVPIKNVTVDYGKGKRTQSIWDGSFIIDSLEQDTSNVTVTFKRPAYMTRVMKYEELNDTIELIPSMNGLSDVIVYGKDRRPQSPAITFSIKDPDALPSPSSTDSVDADISDAIENLLNYKKRKRRKKAIETLGKY